MDRGVHSNRPSVEAVDIGIPGGTLFSARLCVFGTEHGFPPVRCETLVLVGSTTMLLFAKLRLCVSIFVLVRICYVSGAPVILACQCESSQVAAGNY